MGPAIVVKVRDGQVRNTPFYVVMGVTTGGEREILGIWAGDGAEGARFRLQVFTELKNRGVEDVLIAVCDGLKGLPDAITTTWEQTVVQQCVVHLLRNSFRYAGRQHRDGIVKALKPVYTAPSEAAAKDRFGEFAAEWGGRYPAIVKLWESAWAEFVPFLEYDVEIRRVICTTNAIESINARYRRAVRARGHFPSEQSALKCLYLVTRSLDPTGGGRARWVIRWKPALNAFAITFTGPARKSHPLKNRRTPHTVIQTVPHITNAGRAASIGFTCTYRREALRWCVSMSTQERTTRAVLDAHSEGFIEALDGELDGPARSPDKTHTTTSVAYRCLMEVPRWLGAMAVGSGCRSSARAGQGRPFTFTAPPGTSSRVCRSRGAASDRWSGRVRRRTARRLRFDPETGALELVAVFLDQAGMPRAEDDGEIHGCVGVVGNPDDLLGALLDAMHVVAWGRCRHNLTVRETGSDHAASTSKAHDGHRDTEHSEQRQNLIQTTNRPRRCHDKARRALRSVAGPIGVRSVHSPD
jgi:hypothetical protein